MTSPRPSEACVGIEVEFTGLSARAAAFALQAGLGGSVSREDAHAFDLRGSALGDLSVELDIRQAHPQRHGAALAVNPGAKLSALFGSVVSPFVPREMILSPLPAGRLQDVDRAIELLRQAGAKGDGRVLFGTLGLHFNIATRTSRIADIRATTLSFARNDARLRAFIGENDKRLSARLAPAFPDDYVRLLEARSPAQLPGEFIDDYLQHNATRDRALDLLPLLLHLDGPRVRRRLPYEKISARPVFHWRLPVARVGRKGWSVMASWRAWLDVEAEAAQLLAHEARHGEADGTSAARNG
jgi:hypothetical protein